TQFAYEYDGNNRLKKVTAGNLITSITYETNTDNRAMASIGDVSASFTYDDAGRLKQRDDSTGFTTQLDYFDNDNLKTIDYPSGRVVRYEYDVANRVTTVHDDTAGRDYATQLKYHPSGAISSYLAGNGSTHTTIFDDKRDWV